MRATSTSVTERCRPRLSPIVVAVLGLAVSCKCRPTHPLESSVRSATIAASAKPEPPPIPIENNLVALTRGRAFPAARASLATLPKPRQAEPAYRFVEAYLAIRMQDGPAALPLLAELEQKLPELQSDIERLRAEAQLQTADALVGAAWLDSHGANDPWYRAGQTLARLGRRDDALMAIDRGIKRVTRTGARWTAILANYRALRAGIVEAMGDAKRALDDWRWLAVEAPSHAAARARILPLFESGTLRLDASEDQQRLRRLAELGDVAAVEAELARQVPTRRLTNATLAYLRGRARQVGRQDQREGARFLELAADLGIENATQVRIDAARMYVREGDAKQAVRVYDQVANQERSRRLEMQFYAARALASLGDPDAALLRFSRLIERDTAGRWRKSAELERNACRFVTKKLAAAEAGWWSLANDAGYHDERPVLLGLAGLAAHELGRTEEASRRWQSVVSESPLSLAAAFATARLREVAQRSGEPSLVAGSDVVGAASSRDAGASAPVVALPRRTKQLLAFGIDELAADSLHEEDQKNRRQRTSASVEQACRAWATVAYGEHGYIWSRSVRDTFDVREPINDATRWRWQCRFPQPYRAMVEALEQEYRLPRLLLWAVMRQESGFDPDVTSPAGAVGLLQLLPQTASRVAEEFAINDADDLTEPRTNLRLGAAYLRKLLDSFAENLVLAVAAYNAGPKAVALWLRHSGSNSVELFAARIPYAETQRYVERVLGNLVVYRTLNGFDRNLEGLSLYLPEELKDWSALY